MTEPMTPTTHEHEWSGPLDKHPTCVVCDFAYTAPTPPPAEHYWTDGPDDETRWYCIGDATHKHHYAEDDPAEPTLDVKRLARVFHRDGACYHGPLSDRGQCYDDAENIANDYARLSTEDKPAPAEPTLDVERLAVAIRKVERENDLRDDTELGVKPMDGPPPHWYEGYAYAIAAAYEGAKP